MVESALLRRPLIYDEPAAPRDAGGRSEFAINDADDRKPSLRGWIALGRVTLELAEFVRARGLGLALPGPIGVCLDPFHVVQPDLIFVDRGQRAMLGERFVLGAPALVGEVSPFGARRRRARRRLALYAAFGVRECWLVDPETESIEVRVLRDGDLVLLESPDGVARSELLDGFAIDPRGLFALPDFVTEDGDDDA